jgi:hypothetical protein
MGRAAVELAATRAAAEMAGADPSAAAAVELERIPAFHLTARPVVAAPRPY